MSVKIITDSASDITAEQAREHGLIVVPLAVLIDGTEYLDGVTITQEEFYKRLETCAALPVTSQITPHTFAETLKHALCEEDEAIIITLSGKLSGTAQSAAIAAEAYGDRVRVIDSLNVCAGERILVEYALRLRAFGMSADEMAKELEAARERICLVAVLDTLEYVVKGGRLSKTAGFAGAVLNIQPVVGIKDGVLVVLGKAMGARKSNNLLTQTILSRGGVDFRLPYALGYSGSDDTKLREYIDNSRALWEPYADGLPVAVIGSTVGTYSGPGAVAVAFFARGE